MMMMMMMLIIIIIQIVTATRRYTLETIIKIILSENN